MSINLRKKLYTCALVVRDFGILACLLFPMTILMPTTLTAMDAGTYANACRQNGYGFAIVGGVYTCVPNAQPQYTAPPPPSPAQQAYAINVQGNAAFNAGNYELAARLYAQALRLTPYDNVIANNLRNARARPINERGIAAFAAGDWGLAASLFEQALQQNPYDKMIAKNLMAARAGPLNAKGIAAQVAGNWELAASLYEQALRQNPNSAVIKNSLRNARAIALNDKGVDAAAAGDKERALKLYMGAAKLEPNNAIIANNVKKIRASVLFDKAHELLYQDPAKAVVLYEQAARMDPGNATIAASLEYARKTAESRRADEVARKKQEATRREQEILSGKSIQSSIKGFTKSLDDSLPSAASGSNTVKVDVASGGSLGFMDANRTTATPPISKGSGLFNTNVAAPTTEDLGGDRSQKASAKSKTVVDLAAAAATKTNSEIGKAGCVYDGQAGCDSATANINTKAQVAAAQSAAAVAVAEALRKNKQAMANPAIKRNFDFYLQADKVVAEKQAKLEEVQKKLKNGDGDPVSLKAQAGTYQNDINISNANKNAAIRQMKEEAKDKNLAVEFPPEVAVPTSAIDPSKTVNRLEFIGVPSPGAAQ